jgi:hypothetical protein
MILHYPGRPGRAYCGGHKQPREFAKDWSSVTCVNCLAAARADKLTLPRHLRASAA